MKFVALDVEMLDHPRDSVCAIGAVEVARGRVVGSRFRALRPPSLDGRFRWSPCLPRSILATQPTFAEERASLERMLGRADFVAAHNAQFDLNILENCYRAIGARLPTLDYVCTKELAKRVLPLRRFRLPDVCQYLDIALDHHNPLSDARGAAQIVLLIGPREARRSVRRFTPHSARDRAANV